MSDSATLKLLGQWLPWVCEVDQALKIVWASGPLSRRFDDLVGTSLSTWMRTSGGAPAQLLATPDAELVPQHPWLLRAPGGELPVLVAYAPHNDGYLVWARPNVYSEGDAAAFNADELLYTASITDLFAARREAEETTLRLTECRLAQRANNAALEQAKQAYRESVAALEDDAAVTSRSRARFQQMFDNMRSGVAVVALMPATREFVLVDLNRSGAELEQITTDAVLGRPLDEALPGALASGITEAVARVLASGRSELLEDLQYQGRDGQSFRDVYIFGLNDREVVVRFDDVTLRHWSEQELRYQSTLLQNVNEAVIGVNEAGLVQLWNPAAERIYGITAPEMLGKALHKVLPTTYIETTEAEAGRILATQGHWHGEIRQHTKQGAELTLLSSVSTMCDSNNISRGAVIVNRNITERKALESQLVIARRLEAVGQLAAGIAHEINTPTQYVNDNVYFLKDSYAGLLECLLHLRELVSSSRMAPPTPDELGELAKGLSALDLDFLSKEIPQALDQSLDGLKRITTIVSAMKDFSHRSDDRRAPADLNRAIESTVTVSRNEWKYVAEVALELDPALPSVHCSITEVNQVVLNLIVNAAHAIAERNVQEGQSHKKGKITLTTKRAGDQVEIRVADTGAGIPEAIRHRIFEQFFTTKPVGKGTGQGLALARAIIVDKHGGTIEFESTVGVGTVFVLLLPIGTPTDPEGGTP